MRRLRIFTWHVHGTYLLSLTQVPHDFYIPVKPGQPPGYSGRGGPFPWGDNVHEISYSDVRNQDFDVVVFQSHANWTDDQYDILSPVQRRLPRVFIEHDPPRQHPTDTVHPVDDREVVVVHVTHFNRLMWDTGNVPARVVEHGVLDPGVRWSGELDRGIVVVNHIARRGRRLGADLFESLRRRVPLDLVGMGADESGGLGEVAYDRLAAFEARYRFFFNPIRYTSLGLAVCEAMMIGMPIVGLATTEMATTITNGESGWIDNRPDVLADRMRDLLGDPAEARRLGDGARAVALERFSISRFVRDWMDVFADVTQTTSAPALITSPALR